MKLLQILLVAKRYFKVPATISWNRIYTVSVTLRVLIILPHYEISRQTLQL